MSIYRDNFLWGAATSAPQSEGFALKEGKSKSIWDYWYEIEPTKFFNRIGPSNTSNFYNEYKNDLKLMKSINFNSFRTSISWTRLLPDGKNVNKQAVAFYNNLINECEINGIELIINLFHFDLPMWLLEKGGYTSDEFASSYAFYARTCFSLFGDKVNYWATFNEPHVHIECSYLYGYHYPCEVNFKKAIQAGYNTLIAHSLAVQEYRKGDYPGNIGIIMNLSPTYPASNNKEDIDAATIADAINTKSLLDPIVLGEFNETLTVILKKYDLLPKRIENDLSLIKNSKIDFLGVNYYQPRRVQAKKIIPSEIILPDNLYDKYEWPERIINESRGWEIYPKGLYDIAIMIKNDYHNIPWYVAENGMGIENEEEFMNEEGMVIDDYRIEFINDHLNYLKEAISEECNCFGYHLWTAFDCWSWLNAYKNRYGFFRVDLDNNYKRQIKKSGLWFKDMIEKEMR